ncbi:MAG: SCO family protein [Gammaproteobacteria bacterium]
MFFRSNAGSRPAQKVLSCGGDVTFVLGVAATVLVLGACEPDNGDAMNHDHAVEHPAEHTRFAAEQTADDSLANMLGEADPHAHHRHMMESKTYSRSVHDYQLPDLELVNMAAEKTSLLDELNPGKPVMVNFIFTTCTTICPVMSATFAQVQSELGADSDALRMISFSIDPEQDTPERLREYAGRFNAGPQWQFLTGSLADSVAVQKAFDVYRGNKMNHEPTTLMKAADSDSWVRIDGLAKAADIVAEYHRLLGH